MTIGEVSVLTGEWIPLIISFAFASLRTWIRLVRLKLKLSISDLFLFLSMLNALALIICDTYSIHLGAIDPDTINTVPLLKTSFASNYFYDTGIFFPKFSIIALYWTIIPITLPKTRIALHVLTGFAILAALSVFFVDTFWCGLNISSNWSLEEGACSAWSSSFNFRYQYGINMACDSFIILLPVPVLKHLKISKWQRFGVGFTFGLGVITILVSSLRYVHIVGLTDDSNALVYIWSMAEYSASIIIVSIPSFKHLIIPKLSAKSSSNLLPSYALSDFHSNGGDDRGIPGTSENSTVYKRDKTRSDSGIASKLYTGANIFTREGQLAHEDSPS